MARRSERVTRRQFAGARGLRHAALSATVSLALLTSLPASAQSTQSWSDLQNQARNIESNLDTLADWATQASSPWQKQIAYAGIDEQLRALLHLDWEAYRRCMAIRHPTSGNDGDIYKLAQTLKNRDQAAQGLGGIVKIFGGVSADTALSAASGEAADAAKGAALDAANQLASGTRLDGIFGKLGAALSVVDAGTKLYQLSKAVSVGLDAIDARSAADAAMSECKKPPDPDPPDAGTPELKPFPPKPRQPDHPPPPPPPPPPSEPKASAPPQHIPLGKAIIQSLSADSHDG